MGIVVKQSLRNTIITYIGMILGFVNVIWLYPHILQTDQFGLTKLLTSISLVIAQFASLGMGSVTLRFFPYFRDPETHHHGFLPIALIVPLIGFLLFGALFWGGKDLLVHIYGEKSGLFVSYYFYLLPLVGFTLFFNAFDSYVQAHLKSVFGTFAREVLLRILNLFAIMIYFAGWVSFSQFVLLYVFASAVQLLAMIIYVASIGELHLNLRFPRPDRDLVREMGVYGFFAILGGLTTIAISNIDIMMLGALSGLADTAIYFVAFSIGTIILIPARALTRITHPLIAQAWKNNDTSLISEIYRKSSINQLIAGLLVFIGVWANIDSILSILPHEYAAGKFVILYIGLARLFDMATGTNGGIILNSRHYRVDFYTNILLLVLIVITNLIFIPLYGITGAALATAFSILIHNSVKYIFVWIAFDMQPFDRHTIEIIVIGGFILWLSFFIPHLSNVAGDIALRSSIIAIVYVAATYLLKISPDLNRLAENYLSIKKNS